MSEETWRERLSAAITAKGMSKRGVSLAAGMGAGYVHSIISEGKDPTVENLVKITKAIDVPLYQIVFGDHPSAEDHEILELWQHADRAQRRAILTLLRKQA